MQVEWNNKSYIGMCQRLTKDGSRRLFVFSHIHSHKKETAARNAIQ